LYSKLQKLRFLIFYNENFDPFQAGANLRKGAIYEGADENQLVFYLNKFQLKDYSYQIVLRTMAPTTFETVNIEPALIVSKNGNVFHFELWRIVLIFSHLFGGSTER
jgi:hypothetical protein